MDIPHVAKLANLPLTPSQLELFQSQMEKILDYVSQLQQLKLSAHSSAPVLKNVTRPDQPTPSLPPQPTFVVPGILADD